MAKQVHMIVYATVEDDGSVSSVQVDGEMSSSEAHFPYGNVFDTETEEWEHRFTLDYGVTAAADAAIETVLNAGQAELE